MKYRSLKVLIPVCFNIFLMNYIFAQDLSVAAQSIECIGKLHQGELLIQLPSQRNKLNALRNELYKGNDEYKRKVSKAISKLIVERDSFNYYMIQFFNEQYKFSKIYFFSDSDWVALKSNSFLGKNFIDKELQKTIDRREEGKEVFILRNGSTKTQSLEAWVICDRNNAILPSPFPSMYRINNFKTWKNHIFFSSTAPSRDAAYFSRKINQKLTAFYKKSRNKESLQ